MPMRLTSVIASTMLISSGRTRADRKIHYVPDVGVGACGRNTATQPSWSGSSR